MLKGFVSGEEKDIVRIPMGTRNLFNDAVYSAYKQTDGTYIGTVNNFYTTHVTPFTSDDIGKTFTFTLVVKETTSTNVRASANINGSGVNGNNLSAAGTTTVTFTVSSVNDYLYLGYGGGGANPITLENIMLNTGSTALPYEPYGYQEGWEVRDNEDRILWGREDELQTATGTLPFKGYGLPLKPKSLLGNAVQNGTPAPDNIIMPEMCGVRTGNLVFVSADNETHYSNYDQYTISDGTITVTGRMLIGFKVKITPDTAYTVSAVHKVGTLMRIREYTEIPNDWTDGFIKQPVNTELESATFTTSSEAEWILVTFYSENVGQTVSSIMLNAGSTALPYEPYGWKVPFENHGENLFDCDRTKDIIDDSYIRKSDGATVADTTYYISYPIYVSENATYTWKFNDSTNISHSAPTVGFYDASDNMIGAATHHNSVKYFSFTTPNGCKYIRASVCKRLNLQREAMLTPGSEAKPYSPYLNETLPVYLGEVPTVRRVRKWVLTGEETIYGDPSYDRFIIAIPDSLIIGVRLTPAVSSHYSVISDGRSIGDVPNNSIYSDSNNPNHRWFIKTTDYIDVTAFKSYLASEYAAGHPVTIWYVLAEPETAISNEPLCKISTYADELTTIQVHGLSAPLYGIGDYKDTLNLATGVVTRKVKKLVLTGEETDWGTVSGNAPYRIVLPDIVQTSDRNIVLFMTTHYLAVPNSASWSQYATCVSWGFSGGANNKNLVFRDTSQSTLDDFKSYLAAQYAAGTPVTVWYVLANEETETVTVPTGMTGEIEGYLTQVSTPTPTNRSVPKWNGVEETGGTYAVTVYTPPEIPTTTGQNTLTVDTTLAPLSLTVKGHIKELT